jgi:type VI secretion system protein ImpA
MEAEPGVERPTEAAIRAAFTETDRENLVALRDGFDRAIQEILGIGNAFGAVAGPVLDVGNLQKLLETIRSDIGTYEPPALSAPPTPREEDTAGEEAGEAAPAAAEGGAVRRGAMTARSLTGITQRDDALYLLDLVKTYFRSYEPSSPVPMLIDRAQRLATMGFFDILRDLAPNGIDQAQIVAGAPQT